MGSCSLYQRFAAFVLLPLIGVGSPVRVHAAWHADGVPICTETHDQNAPAIVSDGAQGANVIWADRRFGEDLFAQRIDGTGMTVWTPDGLSVCSESHQQLAPIALPAAGNGAVVFWADHREGNYDIYAQRVDGAGGLYWFANGIPISRGPDDETRPLATFDGSVGIIQPVGWNVLWVNDDGTSFDLKMNRVDFNADLRVSANLGGTTLVSNITTLGSVAMATDGVGTASVPKGAVVAWSEIRSGGAQGYDIFARRMNGSGTPQWPSGGVAVCDVDGDQENPAIANVGTSVIIAWDDTRSSDRNIWAQKLDASGSPQWLADGVLVCQFSGAQHSPRLVSDNAGGVIAVWTDVRSGTSKIYAQRLDGNGQRLWAPADGIALCTANGTQQGPAVVTDGAGGVIVAWQDRRNGVEFDLFAQRVDPNGSLLWGPGAAPITQAAGNQESVTLVSDAQSGAIAAWTDRRSGNPDIYANRITSNGTVDVPFGTPTAFRFAFASSNPSRGDMRMTLDLPQPSRVTAEVLDVAGRRLRRLDMGSELGAGVHPLFWDGADEAGTRLPPGLFYVRVRAGAETSVIRVVRLD